VSVCATFGDFYSGVVEDCFLLSYDAASLVVGSHVFIKHNFSKCLEPITLQHTVMSQENGCLMPMYPNNDQSYFSQHFHASA
jgi:hypothetical protein